MSSSQLPDKLDVGFGHMFKFSFSLFMGEYVLMVKGLAAMTIEVLYLSTV